MKKKYLVLAIGLLMALGAGYGWFFMYNKPHVDYQKETAAFVGEANDLLKSAKSDQQHFIDTYLNKAVELTGEVTSAETSSFSLGQGTYCTLDSTQTVLPAVATTITLKGRVVGIEEDILTEEMMILVDQCIVKD